MPKEAHRDRSRLVGSLIISEITYTWGEQETEAKPLRVSEKPEEKRRFVFRGAEASGHFVDKGKLSSSGCPTRAPHLPYPKIWGHIKAALPPPLCETFEASTCTRRL